MFDFLRRIPEKLGLTTKVLVGKSRNAASDNSSTGPAKKPARGRGTGRGTMPKGGGKPKGRGPGQGGG